MGFYYNAVSFAFSSAFFCVFFLHINGHIFLQVQFCPYKLNWFETVCQKVPGSFPDTKELFLGTTTQFLIDRKCFLGVRNLLFDEVERFLGVIEQSLMPGRYLGFYQIISFIPGSVACGPEGLLWVPGTAFRMSGNISWMLGCVLWVSGSIYREPGSFSGRHGAFPWCQRVFFRLPENISWVPGSVSCVPGSVHSTTY